MSGLFYIVLAAMALDSATATTQEPLDGKTAPITTITPLPARRDDRVTLKSGKVLQGVKVVRTTPFKLFLEIIPSVEPLEIPAKQVVSVAYGQPEAEGGGITEPAPEVNPPESNRVLAAVKLSPDLAKRMTSPISDKEVLFQKQDLLNTLRSAAIMGGVSVTFGPQLESLPPEERTFSLRLEGGVSFEDFYRDSILAQVPWLKMEYRFDTVHFERE